MNPVIEQLREGRKRLAIIVAHLCANDPESPMIASHANGTGNGPGQDTRAAAEKLRSMSERLHRLVW